MPDILLGVVVGLMIGVTACLLLRGRKSATVAPAAVAPAASVQEPAPAPAPPAASLPADAPLAEVVLSLARTLAPLAEEVTHPDQLQGMPEFQAVVTALRRPDATMPLLEQCAFGGDWPLACAALTVLAERHDRQFLRDVVLGRLPGTRPYVLRYAFRFLTSLEHRAPVGAVVLAATPWWADNPVIPDFVRDYFVQSAELGDHPGFGDLLDRLQAPDSAPVVALLQKVQHPFAQRLLATFNAWLATRVDQDFLRTVGTIWGPADQDALLVPPAAWREQLTSAEAAIGRSHPRSVLVSGDPQTGKSAFIKILAGRLQRQGWTVFAASGSELMADQIYIGQLEGRIRKIVECLHPQRKLIWYVRDLAQMAAAGVHQGQSASIFDQLLPAIASGNLIVIGECNQASAARLFQTRPSLRSLMEVVPLQPMDDRETLDLAHEVGRRITEHTSVAVPEPAIAATMDLAQHYLGSGRLPGPVLELLKRAADRSIAEGRTTLTAENVVATLSQISGLPSIVLDTSQRVDLAGVQAFFAQRVMGQDEAVKTMVDRIAMLKAGLTDPGRPIGVFLFAGPTGTGKTELAKTLAEFLFGSADRMIRLDMSEFQAVESVAKIVGHAGDGGSESLADRIRKQPFSVVLLDEFEKANPSCWDLFLQIFDDGRLTDARGGEVDFRHSIIILTSNLGATAHRGGGLGFRPDPDAFIADQVLRAIGQTFRPEFVNRLDRVIVFRPLSRELMRGILHKELAEVQERRGLRERAWAIEWEASAIEFLLDRGFSPEMGARPLKRAIDQLLLAPLAATLVEHRFPQGDQFLFVRSDGQKIDVEFVDPDAEPAGGGARDEETGDGRSLPAIVLAADGSAAERATLTAAWQQIGSELSGEPWKTKVDALRLRLADPAIWSAADRHLVFSGLELADRISEARRTADRLYRRYDTARERTARASRELAGRLALQLYNLRQGLDDFAADAPVDVLLRVEPAMEDGSDGAGGWCARLTDMYRQWAAKRRMQIREVPSGTRTGPPVLLITGFGAYRTVTAENGLHVLENDQRPDGGRRIVARVTTASGPAPDLAEADVPAAAAKLLAAAPVPTGIVRRYRDGAAPIVRDVAGGWRSGRLSAVLGGDFDLIGEAKRARPAP